LSLASEQGEVDAVAAGEGGVADGCLAPLQLEAEEVAIEADRGIDVIDEQADMMEPHRVASFQPWSHLRVRQEFRAELYGVTPATRPGLTPRRSFKARRASLT